MTKKQKKIIYSTCNCYGTYKCIVKHIQNSKTKEIKCFWCGDIKSKEFAKYLKIRSAKRFYTDAIDNVNRKYFDVGLSETLGATNLDTIYRMCVDYCSIRKDLTNLYQSIEEVIPKEDIPIPKYVIDLIFKSQFSRFKSKLDLRYINSTFNEIYAVDLDGNVLIYDKVQDSFRVLPHRIENLNEIEWDQHGNVIQFDTMSYHEQTK